LIKSRSILRGCSRLLRLLLLVVSCIAATPGSASADEDELAVSLDVGPAAVFVQDVVAATRDGSRAGVLVGGRVAYGVADWLAVEGRIGYLRADGARTGDVTFQGKRGDLEQDVRALRVAAGGELRLGVAWIPTLAAHAGYQYRSAGEAWLFDPAVAPPASNGLCESGNTANPCPPGRDGSELVLEGSAGLEHRFGVHWVAGLSVAYARSLGGFDDFASLEIPLRVSYYTYP
jgi:hypothetical protein